MSGVGVDAARLADEQAALRRVAELVARGAAPAVVLEAVTSEACALVGVGSTALLRLDRDGSSRIVALHDTPPGLSVGDREPETGEGIVQRVLRSGRTARVDSYAGVVSPEADRARRLGVTAAAGAPILVEGRLWGVIVAMTSASAVADGLEVRLAEFAELAAIAIAGAQSREDLQELVDEQTALRRVAELVAGGASSTTLFDAVAAEACRLLGGHFTALLRFEPDGPAVVVAVDGAERVAHVIAVGMRLATEGDGVVQRVQRLARAARIDDYDELPGANAATARALGLTSGVGAPILTEGRVWGAITVLGTGDPLPGDAEARLGMFAELVATAISNSQARAGLAALADEQSALRRVAELVARGVDQDELFATVAVEASRLVGDEATTLLRTGDDRSFTVVAAHRGPAPVGTRVDVAPDDEGVVAEILRTRRPARLDDYGTRPGPAYARDDYGVGSSVGVPIVVDGRIWGVLGATTQGRRLPEAAERRLGQFADLVAAALANAQARRAVEELADEQTALRVVAELVARGAPLDEVFTAVAREASVLLGDHATALLRYDPDDHATVVAAHASPVRPGLRIPSDGDTATGRVRRTGRPHRMHGFEGTPLADTARTLGVGAAVTVPVLVEGRVWGNLSTTTAGPPPPAGTEERLAQLAELAGAAIANAENKEKLSASRARVISTADETRRRLQRDVHDGAQQRLVHTIIALKLARDASARGESPDEFVREALTHAERANAELRDLVRGILPAALTRGGLRAGVESLVEDLTLPVDVRVHAPRLPTPTETTAYFIVAEALTNAVKHARATRAEVEIALDGDALVIVVRDDGAGGADPSRGSGLLGLSDRVDACGGTIAVNSPPGGGTTVRAVLPPTRSGPAS